MKRTSETAAIAVKQGRRPKRKPAQPPAPAVVTVASPLPPWEQPPRPVDKGELARLCRDTARNDQAIKTSLWDVAWFVAAAINGVDRDDCRQAAYEKMVRAIPKYTPRRGEAFAFFYTAGYRAALTFAEKETGTKERPRMATVSTFPPTKVRSAGCLSAAPVTNGHGRQRVKKSEPMAILDASIRRIRAAMEKHDPDDVEYRHLEIGMTYMQCLRFECVGVYLPTRTPTIGYSANRVLPQGN